MISRRDILTAPAAALLQTQVRPLRPNILFLMSDQHRGDCMGNAGNAAAITPNLDRLAREGARFTSAYSSTPSCTPARACLLTGLSPWNHGMLGYSKVAQRYPYEMPRAMADAGYHTCAIGKLHYTPQRNTHGYHTALLDESGRSESIDFRSDYRSWFYSQAPNLNPDETGIGWNDYPAKPYVLPERLHPTTWTADCAVNFLKTYASHQPFFLKVSFARPHSPYDPPSRWFNKFADRDLPQAHLGKWASRWEQKSSQDPSLWHGDLGAKQVRESRQGYYGSVSFVDEQIGRVLETLEQRGLMENTLIVYTSDHGDMTGDHNLWRKSYAYEGSAKIPMLIRWPKGLGPENRGQVRPEPVELRDIFATFLDTAGIEPSRKIDGESMLRLVNGKSAGWREFIDLEHDVCYGPDNHWSALTDGKVKYIFHARDGQEQLFDLKRDPGELHDLSGELPSTELLRLWRERMISHLAPRGEGWTAAGKLAFRPKSILHSPNYPKG